jgi:ribosomal protein L11 methyltransferase
MPKTEEKWFALEITVDEAASEAIEFALNELESLGTEIDSLGKKKTELIEVVGYFNEKPSNETLQFELNEALRIYGFAPEAIQKTTWRDVENQDWLHEWKKHWKPTVTDKFIIAPLWETVENTEKIVIRIEPNMAFGTGTHETTKLCLRAIEKYYEPNMSFFDLGTGTGILSIAIAKLQSQDPSLTSQVGNFENQTTLGMGLGDRKSILACDTDEDSVKIAKENAELNDSGIIDFYIGSISDETPRFDFVCANVTADVIVPLLPLLVEKSKKILVLSGILVEQEDLVSSKLFELGITEFEVKTDGEWISISVLKS